MKNHATTILVKSAEMPTHTLAIVQPLQKSADSPMSPPRNNALQEYVLKVMSDEGFSFQDIETEARKKKGRISRGTVQSIASGETKNPGIFTLANLALGLNKPLEELIMTTVGSYLSDPAAFDRSELGSLWELTKQLPPNEQKFVRRLFQMVEREVRRLLSGE